MKWQPIETAPKNGSKVAIRWESLDGEMVNMAKWNGEFWVSDKINPWSGRPYVCINPTGWLPFLPQ